MSLRLLGCLLVLLASSCARITQSIGRIQSESPSNSIQNDPDSSSQKGHDAAINIDASSGSPDYPVVTTFDSSTEIVNFVDSSVPIPPLDSGWDGYVPETCVEERIAATPLGLDIYIMMDALLFTSFSVPPLTQDLDTQWTELWTSVRTNVSRFVEDEDSEGIGVGIQYYGKSGSQNYLCNPQTYYDPAVEIKELPGNADEIIGSFPLYPFTTSPVVPALEGAIDQMRSRTADYPERKQVVFLVTGIAGLLLDPFDPFCNSDLDTLSDIVQEGLDHSPSVQTYIFGLYSYDIDFTYFPSMQDILSTITQSAGIEQPYFAALNQAELELTSRLQEARDTAKPSKCDIYVPTRREDGSVVDPEQISLVLVDSAGDSEELIQVSDSEECDDAPMGWYFDDEDNPTVISTCEESCDHLDTISDSQIEFLLGCQSSS